MLPKEFPWEDPKSNLWYEDAEGYLVDKLGFCGCGSPEDALIFLLSVLETIFLCTHREGQDPQDFHRGWEQRKAIFKTVPSGLEYIFYYYLDSKELIEHGGAVPGWLTNKGIDLLNDLREYKEKYYVESE